MPVRACFLQIISKDYAGTIFTVSFFFKTRQTSTGTLKKEKNAIPVIDVGNNGDNSTIGRTVQNTNTAFLRPIPTVRGSM